MSKQVEFMPVHLYSLECFQLYDQPAIFFWHGYLELLQEIIMEMDRNKRESLIYKRRYWEHIITCATLVSVPDMTLSAIHLSLETSHWYKSHHTSPLHWLGSCHVTPLCWAMCLPLRVVKRIWTLCSTLPPCWLDSCQCNSFCGQMKK